MRSAMRMSLLATVVGATWIVSPALAQERDRPEKQERDRPEQKGEKISQSADFQQLREAGRELRQQLVQRLEDAGRKQGLRIDEQELMVSLTDQGIIAGAAATASPSPQKPETSAAQEGQRTDSTGEKTGQDPSGSPERRMRQERGSGNEAVSGIVFITGDLSRQLRGSGPADRSLRDQDPGSTLREKDAGKENTGTDGNRGSDGSDAMHRAASEQAHLFQVVCPEGSGRVELRDENGGIVTSFPLIIADSSSDRPTAGETRRDSQAGVKSHHDWTLIHIHASIVCGLTKQT